MAYKALYRTYRPASFDEIAGQEHITKTFRNALKNDKIAHAYLFSGPRGTGKTSIAKIIAKAVNCEKAPRENPCNECEICRGIDQNMINDVIEIDAASNNGVDEIREIRDKVKYLPGVGRYKVYIIDEVHMLSTGAFNALLKTLEEPPKHVIFILATTEPHKIPATIHSRCQRFDFRGVSVPEMILRLDTIITEEEISISKEAVKVIAESAEGGMRDAISLLDQVVSYTDKKVIVDDVHAIKGTVSNEKLLAVAEAIYQNNSVEAIKLLDDLITLGKEAPRLVENLIKFYRDLLVFKNTNISHDDQIIFSDKQFIELSKKLSNNLTFFYIDVLNKAQNDMKWTTNSKLYLELALIKMVDKVEKQEIIFEEEVQSLKLEINQLREELNNIDLTPQIVEKVVVKEQNPIELIIPKEEDTAVQTILSDTPREATIEKRKELVAEDVTNPVEEKLPLKTEESTRDKPKVEAVEEAKEANNDLFSITFEPEKPIQKEKLEEPYKTYDVRYVEQILNNGNREFKIQLNKRWFDIERFVGPENISYAKSITTGRVVATDGTMLIIQYSNASLCNRMMKPDIKEKIRKILSDFYKKDLDYLALPKLVWEQKSQEFIKKWKENKDSYIKLTPINDPALKEMPIFDKEIDDLTPDSVKDAMNIFGSSSVIVKKGE